MRRLLVLILALVAVPAAPASAGFYGAEPIDGPAPEGLRVGDLDVARDGTGAVAYTKREGGVDHVFVSRLVNGAFQPPERVDGGLDSSGADPVVAASDGGRVAVVYISAGQAFASVWAAGATGWTPPQPLAGGASQPSIDMSINGVAYTTFTAGGDIRAARLERGATTFNLLAQPLDVDPANDAGAGTGRSRVAVSADGTGLAVWGEAGGVFARRLYNGNVSTIFLPVSVPEIEGHAGLTADLPDVDIEDDSSYAWISFRQAFADGGGSTARAVARRLRGSRFEGPVLVDGLGWGGEGVLEPRIEISGRGEGQVTTGLAGSGAAVVDLLKDNKFNGGKPIGGTPGTPSQPVGAIAETIDRVVAYFQGDQLVVRQYDDNLARRTPPAPGPETVLSVPDFGPVVPAGGLDAASNRAGDVAVVAVQRNDAGSRLVAATFDRAPGAFNGHTTTKWRKFARPPFAWATSFELWGPLTYTVEVDGIAVGQTTTTKLTPVGAIPDGEHKWRVVATDRRGQSTVTRTRTLRVDATKPTVSFSARRDGGRRVTVTVKASDANPTGARASGVRTVKIDWGDGSRVTLARKATHRYSSGGAKTIRVSATDGAGNAVAVTKRVTPRAK